MDYEAAIKTMKENSAKRKFTQSVNLIINLKNVDLKKPENQIKIEVVLPNGKGKVQKGALIGDDNLGKVGEKSGLSVFYKKNLEELEKNRKNAKKIGNTYDFFICQADMMTNMAKALGSVLGPRNKMPQPVPPNILDLKPIVERLTKTIKFQVKSTPVINCLIGTEAMDDKKLSENARVIYEAVEHKLPKGIQQIKNVQVKTTMGKPIKVI